MAQRSNRQRRPSGSSSPSRRPAETRSGSLIEGRGQEITGLVIIAVAIVVGLGVYFGKAGMAGDGLDALAGWLVGIGRFGLPVALVAIGVALIRAHRSSSPPRVFIGWTMIVLAVLGIADLIGHPEPLTDRGEVRKAGGWIGVAIAEPLRSLLATAGAAVLLVVLLVGGILILTQTSLRTMALQTRDGVGTVTRPIGRAARKALTDLSTLASERAGNNETPQREPDPASSPRPDVPGEPMLYDGAADDEAIFTPPTETPKRKRSVPRGGREVGGWFLPSLRLLKKTRRQSIDMRTIEQRGRVLQQSLASHGVETELIGQTVGPTVTRYELELGPGVKVNRVTSLQKDIAYALAAVDVRILAPIPGRSAIGVEVPNHDRQLVALGDLMTSEEASAITHPLEVAIGKDIAGKPVFLNIATTPHLLIAGATGAGKSSGLNCIITSLLMRTTPDQVRLILIDPKQVEMGQYQRLPHLLTEPVTNPKKAANALGWAVKEMERRYDVLSECGYRDITGYNNAWDAGMIDPPVGVDPEDSPYERMPYIVVIVDELNDLMLVAARDVEESITRVAQKARAVGIHLVVATQRPSVNVITGVIKANVPARMAFSVSSSMDSRVILDQVGAEKLVGKGDMLLMPGNSSTTSRIQGAWVTEDEVREIVGHWREQAPEPVYSRDVEGAVDESADGHAGGQLDVTSDANAFSSNEEDDDAVMARQAMELVVRSQSGSTSMLQRKLKVGFARAGRIMDELEE
ncbi:MAG: cell division protein FtsK, partial [Ilumatobacter coccineus]